MRKSTKRIVYVLGGGEGKNMQRGLLWCLVVAVLGASCAVCEAFDSQPGGSLLVYDTLDRGPTMVPALDGRQWHSDGLGGSGYNRMGRAGSVFYDLALRFHTPQVMAGETFVYARLVLPGAADGEVESVAQLRIVGNRR